MVKESSEIDSYYATGRRKGASARVWLFKGRKGFVINGQEHAHYLQRNTLQTSVEQPFKDTNTTDLFCVRVNVTGGVVAGQAGAIKLGIARALLKYDQNLRPVLRRGGHLTRDPREKERKKPGRKAARRSFQYTKR